MNTNDKYIMINSLTNLLLIVGRYCGKHYPKLWISFRYFLRFRKRINWRNPRTLNEKILYLSMMTDTTQWSALSDKYKVRKYIEKCGYGESLVTLYGKWDEATMIDFDALPSSCVLKTNHGCGEIVMVRDKNELNREEVISYFQKAISQPYGEIEGGKHYWRIKPCIVAEELLINDKISKQYSDSIIDYKFWCFDGIVHYVLVCSNRTKHSLDIMLYDKTWKAHPEYCVFTNHYKEAGQIPKPDNFVQMIHMAETLAKPFPCVRVDLYNIGGKIYFGEMTFTSLGGLMNYFTKEFLERAGGLIDLNYPNQLK